MGIIQDIHLNFKLREILRWEGIKDHSKINAELKFQILKALSMVIKTRLLEPVVAYETYSTTEIIHNQLLLEDSNVIHNLFLSSLLSKSKKLAIAVWTIGPKLEKQVNEYFENKEALQGLILDGIGNAAMATLSQEVYKLLKIQTSFYGYNIGSLIRPGIKSCGFDLPIIEQWHLLKLIPIKEIGVRLTSTGIMVPLKSASMIIGMGPKTSGWIQTAPCAKCSIKKMCNYNNETKK